MRAERFGLDGVAEGQGAEILSPPFFQPEGDVGNALRRCVDVLEAQVSFCADLGQAVGGASRASAWRGVLCQIRLTLLLKKTIGTS